VKYLQNVAQVCLLLAVLSALLAGCDGSKGSTAPLPAGSTTSVSVQPNFPDGFMRQAALAHGHRANAATVPQLATVRVVVTGAGFDPIIADAPANVVIVQVLVPIGTARLFTIQYLEADGTILASGALLADILTPNTFLSIPLNFGTGNVVASLNLFGQTVIQQGGPLSVPSINGGTISPTQPVLTVTNNGSGTITIADVGLRFRRAGDLLDRSSFFTVTNATGSASISANATATFQLTVQANNNAPAETDQVDAVVRGTDQNGNSFALRTATNPALLRVNTSGVLQPFAGGGTNPIPDLNGPRIPATSAQMLSPSGLAQDTQQNLYIADSFVSSVPPPAVYLVDASGNIGNFASGFFSPISVAVAPDSPMDFLWVVDSASGGIFYRIPINTAFNSTVSVTSTGGLMATVNVTLGAMPLTISPVDVVYDAVAQRMIAVDEQNQIVVAFDPKAGNPSNVFDGTLICFFTAQDIPRSLAVTSNRILISLRDGTVRSIPNGAVLTPTTSTTFCSLPSSSLLDPQLDDEGVDARQVALVPSQADVTYLNIAPDASGNLFIARPDTSGPTTPPTPLVREIDTNFRVVTFAGLPTVASPYNTSGVLANQTSLITCPSDLLVPPLPTYKSSGTANPRLLVAVNDRVLIVVPQ
jgi:hypothetical protein